MKLWKFIAAFIFCSHGFVSCVARPDVDLLDKDMGINLPKEYKIVYADSGPFGLGADANIKYNFQFDSLGYSQLTKSIESSILFNTLSKEDFRCLDPNKKIDIIKILAQRKMSSYWIKTDSNYVYDGDELFLNEPDGTYKKLALKRIYLPNYDSSSIITIPKYKITAIVDRKKFTLYYNFIHI